MRITKLFGALALGGILAAGVAYAAATSSTSALPAPQAAEATTAGTPVTATWAMGVGSVEEIIGTASVDGTLTASFALGDGITNVAKRTGMYSSDGTTWNLTDFPIADRTDNHKIENEFVEFIVTPANGLFLPTNVSFYAATGGWGDGHLSVSISSAGKTQELINDHKAKRPAADRDNVTREECKVSLPVSGLEASEGPVTVRISFWNGNSKGGTGRKIGLADVVISGTLYDEGAEIPDPVVEVPSDWKGEVAPGQFNAVVNGYPWTFNGTKYQSCNKIEDGSHIAYVKTGTSCAVEFYCTQAGVYSASFVTDGSNNNADITFTVTDLSSGSVEVETVFPFKSENEFTVVLPGRLSVGKKKLNIAFSADHNSWIGNFHSPELKRIASQFAQISNVAIEGVENSAAEGYDWNFLLPETYAGENVVLNVAAENGAVTANGEPVVDGKVTVATPAPGQETVVNLSLAANEGAYAAQTEYAVRLFHIGDVQVAGLTVDGKDVTTAELLAALNSEAAAATLAGNCYTAVPSLSATMLDGSVANAAVTVEGTTATATFSGKAGDKTKTFTLAVEGVHTYAKAEADQAVKIVYDSANNQADGSWSNGLYTIRNSNDGWGGTQFKFRVGTHTLEVPANVVVKQLVFAKLGDNYATGKVSAVTSEGATVYLPTNSEFTTGDANRYNLVVNIEGHQAGTPISFTFEGGSQPVAWFELLVEEQKLQGEPTVQSGSNTQVDTKNHCVVTLDFGRKMQECVAEYNGKTVKADGGTTALKFSLWDLAWGEETVLTIPAGAAKDVDGNTNSEAITYTVAVAQQPTTVSPVEAITYVSNVDELKAAVASVMASNNTADAPRHIIFLKNGDYDLGTSTAEAPILHLNKAYNVSIIGEDRDGVVVHGSITGISYPVFSTRNSTNIYMENFTIRNDLDWGCFDAEGNGDGVGVGVAHYGGKRDIMVNMRLQSNQDTQVTGEQGYYYNCEIHGSVDFICGGGNHFYDHCTFVTTRKGSVVAAPSTSAAQKWGYVFSYCTIKGISGYNLGRPWDNEPRCYWLNTTMEANCSANGWDKMGNLVTHFYEYNSMDASGNALDLSGRGNSPTSTNKYNPVLTAEEAAEFTVENVLGGDDSWLATEETVGEIAAPEGVAYEKQTETANAHIWWYPVEGAAGYLIYNNGEYLGYAPGDHHHFDLATNTSYKKVASRADEDFSYTIRAISPNGTMSAHSFAMTSQNPTGIETVGADSAAKVEYYNLQGQPVAEGYRGAVIKVETAADGSRTVSKAFID